MKRALFLTLLVLLGWFVLATQGRSLDRLGQRRFRELDRRVGPLRVGVAWPFAANRDSLADGLRLAREELAAQGFRIDLVLRDPGLDDAGARRVALAFAQDPTLSAVLGCAEDSSAMNAALICEASRLLFVDLGCTRTDLTPLESPYFIRTMLSADQVAQALAGMLVARGCRKIALVYPQDSPGEDLVDPLALGLEAAGGRLVYRHAYPRPDPDFRQPVNELKGIDADLVVVAGLELQAGTFLRTAREFGLATPVLGGLDDSPGGRARSGQTRDGTLHLAPYDVASGTPENQAFVRRFRARHHRQPDAWAAQGYDALHLLARACRSTGSRNPLDLSYAIRSMPPWEGANGLYLFDGHGALRDKPLAIPGLAPKAPEPGELSPAGTHLPENR